MSESLLALIAPGLTALGFLALVITQFVARRPVADTATEAPLAVSDADAHVFEYADGQLVGASRCAKAALNDAGLSSDSYDVLMTRLGRIFPDIRSRFDLALEACRSEQMSELSADGPITVHMEPRLNGPRITITGLAAPFADQALVDLDRFQSQSEELVTLKSMAQISPVPTWRENARGQINWTNEAYRNLVGEADVEGEPETLPPVRLFQSAPVAKPGDTPKARRSALKMHDGGSRVYETLSLGQGDNSVHFAIDATATALAEDSLRNFAQTLTQTFAELPIGLAIFDRARHLVMFNPALMDLTSLSPEWLSAKPTLYDMLNELREKRMVPERKDFNDWRNQLSEVERSAVNGTFQETWTLPSGQVYRVIGRPHPQGAIAFFVEDITSEIAVTRRIRGEKRLQDNILNVISEAVVAFDGQGRVCASNDRFTEMWEADPLKAETIPDIRDIAMIWQDKCHPSPVWGDLRDFVFQSTERVEWTGSVIHRDGRTIMARISPLPGHVTLVSFAETDEPAVASGPREVKLASLNAG